MKKYSFIIAALCLALSLCSCSTPKKTDLQETTEATTIAETTAEPDFTLDKEYNFGDLTVSVNKSWKATSVKDVCIFDIGNGFKLTLTRTEYNNIISDDEAIKAYMINNDEYTTEYTSDERDISGRKAIMFTQYQKKDSEELLSRHLATTCNGYSYDVFVSVPDPDANRSNCFELINDIAASAKLAESEEKGTEKQTEPVTEKQDDTPLEYKNALDSALSYLDYSAFSKEGLRGQLEYEKYSADAINYALENCGADWNQEAVESAKEYLEYSSFSKQELYDQLIYEKFTEGQAQYGVDQVYK